MNLWQNGLLYTAKFHYSDSQRTRSVPDYQTFLIMRQYLYRPKFLHSPPLSLYCSYTSAAQLIREFHLDTSICWFMVIRVLFCLLWNLHIAEEFDAVGDNWSGCNRTTEVQTFMETFLDMSMISASLMKLYYENFQSWNYCPKVSDYQDF